MTGWNRGGQTDAVFSKAKSDAELRHAEEKAARARDLKAAKAAQKAAKKQNKEHK